MYSRTVVRQLEAIAIPVSELSVGSVCYWNPWSTPHMSASIAAESSELGCRGSSERQGADFCVMKDMRQRLENSLTASSETMELFYMENKRCKTDWKKCNRLRTSQPLTDFKTLSYVILLTHKIVLKEFLFFSGCKVAVMCHRAFPQCKSFPEHRYDSLLGGSSY